MVPVIAPLIARLIAKPLVTKAIGLPWLTYLKIGGAVSVLAFIGWREVQHRREVGRLHVAIAVAEQQAAAEKIARLEQETLVAEVTINRDQLAGEVRKQNEAVGRLVLARKAEEQAAALAAVRVLSQAREDAAALRAPTSLVPPGEHAMNAWLQEHFGGSQ